MITWLDVDDDVCRLDTALRALEFGIDMIPDHDPATTQAVLVCAVAYLRTVRDSIHNTALRIKSDNTLTVVT